MGELVRVLQAILPTQRRDFLNVVAMDIDTLTGSSSPILKDFHAQFWRYCCLLP